MYSSGGSSYEQGGAAIGAVAGSFFGPAGTVVGAALGGAIGGAIGGKSARRKARKARKRQEARFRKGAEAAREAFGLESSQLRLQEMQDREGLVADTFEVRREALEASSTSRLAALEGGGSGNSLQALMMDFARQEGEADANLRINQGRRGQQRLMELQGARARMKDRTAGLADFTPVHIPSMAEIALRAGSAGFNAYAQYGGFDNLGAKKTAGGSYAS